MTKHAPILPDEAVPLRRARQAKAEPRGLRRDDAAAYVGVSVGKFVDWVERGLMPKPKRQDGVVVWDRFQLDQAFDALPDGTEEKDTWADLG